VGPSTPVNRVQSLIRWRAGCSLAAVLLPLGLSVVFERQARRLDALASHGRPVEAQVTAVSRDQHTTFYAYQVDGKGYTWNVARGEAPFAVGQRFPTTYLPEDPSLNRPIANPRLAAAESEENRRFSRKVVLGLGVLLLFFAGLAHRDLRRIRSGAPSELSDPKAYRRRLVATSAWLLPLLLLIGAFHVRDALEKGESVLPSAIASGLAMLIVAGIFFFSGRDGPWLAQQRSVKVLRWLSPMVIAFALLKMIGILIGK
jgi:hypothetical protein